jgi:hypothetical protein
MQMMDKNSIEQFTFESSSEYEQAQKELEFIRQLRKNADLTIGKNALKIYNKAVSDKMFETVIGYRFLEELRQTIVQSGVAAEESLSGIPVKKTQKSGMDVVANRLSGQNRFQKLYEGQILLNKKMKIALFAMIVLLAGFVIINFRYEYSIFTYFTNYKSNMEEELIDKYENWQTELEEREQKLEESEQKTENGGK